MLQNIAGVPQREIVNHSDWNRMYSVKQNIERQTCGNENLVARSSIMTGRNGCEKDTKLRLEQRIGVGVLGNCVVLLGTRLVDFQ